MKNKEPVQYRAAGGVRYEFKRKRVKNINLRVRADGSVAVSAPLGTPLAQVDAFVAGRARWIEAARVRALARGEEEQRPCSVSREDALALFTQVSDAVFPLFAQVLNGQRPVLKVRQMKRAGACVCRQNGRSRSVCAWRKSLARLSNMWCCTNMHILSGQTTAPLFGLW